MLGYIFTDDDRFKKILGIVLGTLIVLCFHVMFAAMVPSLFGIHLVTAAFVEQYFVLVIAVGIIGALNVMLFGSVILSTIRKSSLPAEILNDYKLIESQYNKPGRQMSIVYSLVGYALMYNLVLPYVAYVLLRYRKLKTIALDPDLFGHQINGKAVPGMAVFRMLKEERKSLISENEIGEHFYPLGNRYFLKSEESALYICLAHSGTTLFENFGYNNDELYMTIVDCVSEHNDVSPGNEISNIVNKSIKFV